VLLLFLLLLLCLSFAFVVVVLVSVVFVVVADSWCASTKSNPVEARSETLATLWILVILDDAVLAVVETVVVKLEAAATDDVGPDERRGSRPTATFPAPLGAADRARPRASPADSGEFSFSLMASLRSSLSLLPMPLPSPPPSGVVPPMCFKILSPFMVDDDYWFGPACTLTHNTGAAGAAGYTLFSKRSTTIFLVFLFFNFVHNL
jgi:hypothetical protein